jgi:hypothetical protein
LTRLSLFVLATALCCPLAVLAQQVGCGGIPGPVAQKPKNGCGGVPGTGGGPVLGLPEQWLMHDGSGSTFADATANANTITASNITWGTGMGVPSPIFNGTNSSAVAAQTAITDFDGTKPFSVSIWVNPAANGSTFVGNLLPSSSNFTGWELGLQDSVGQITFFLINSYPGNYIIVQTLTSVTFGTPQNVILTYDGSQHVSGVTIYISGIAQPFGTTNDTFTGSSASGAPITVGNRVDGSTPYTGSMSNLQIFSGVLSTGQIAAIQTAGP